MSLDFDTDSVWATAADALHAYAEHEGDWRDGVCCCDLDVATVLKASKFEVLVAELRAAQEAQRVDRLLIRQLRPFIGRNHSNKSDEYRQALVNARSSLDVYDKVAGGDS